MSYSRGSSEEGLEHAPANQQQQHQTLHHQEELVWGKASLILELNDEQGHNTILEHTSTGPGEASIPEHEPEAQPSSSSSTSTSTSTTEAPRIPLQAPRIPLVAPPRVSNVQPAPRIPIVPSKPPPGPAKPVSPTSDSTAGPSIPTAIPRAPPRLASLGKTKSVDVSNLQPRMPHLPATEVGCHV